MEPEFQLPHNYLCDIPAEFAELLTQEFHGTFERALPPIGDVEEISVDAVLPSNELKTYIDRMVELSQTDTPSHDILDSDVIADLIGFYDGKMEHFTADESPIDPLVLPDVPIACSAPVSGEFVTSCDLFTAVLDQTKKKTASTCIVVPYNDLIDKKYPEMEIFFLDYTTDYVLHSSKHNIVSIPALVDDIGCLQFVTKFDHSLDLFFCGPLLSTYSPDQLKLVILLGALAKTAYRSYYYHPVFNIENPKSQHIVLELSDADQGLAKTITFTLSGHSAHRFTYQSISETIRLFLTDFVTLDSYCLPARYKEHFSLFTMTKSCRHDRDFYSEYIGGSIPFNLESDCSAITSHVQPIASLQKMPNLPPPDFSPYLPLPYLDEDFKESPDGRWLICPAIHGLPFIMTFDKVVQHKNTEEVSYTIIHANGFVLSGSFLIPKANNFKYIMLGGKVFGYRDNKGRHVLVMLYTAYNQITMLNQSRLLHLISHYGGFYTLVWKIIDNFKLPDLYKDARFNIFKDMWIASFSSPAPQLYVLSALKTIYLRGSDMIQVFPERSHGFVSPDYVYSIDTMVESGDIRDAIFNWPSSTKFIDRMKSHTGVGSFFRRFYPVNEIYWPIALPSVKNFLASKDFGIILAATYPLPLRHYGIVWKDYVLLLQYRRYLRYKTDLHEHVKSLVKGAVRKTDESIMKIIYDNG